MASYMPAAQLNWPYAKSTNLTLSVAVRRELRMADLCSFITTMRRKAFRWLATSTVGTRRCRRFAKTNLGSGWRKLKHLRQEIINTNFSWMVAGGLKTRVTE